jgi:hypothetical protein
MSSFSENLLISRYNLNSLLTDASLAFISATALIGEPI